MKSTSVSDVLATANAAMVGREPDVTGALAALLSGVVAALPARAAAVLVEVDGGLELLAATNHRVADLEAYQAQVDDGPCLDALRSGVEVHAVGVDDLEVALAAGRTGHRRSRLPVGAGAAAALAGCRSSVP